MGECPWSSLASRSSCEYQTHRETLSQTFKMDNDKGKHPILTPDLHVYTHTSYKRVPHMHVHRVIYTALGNIAMWSQTRPAHRDGWGYHSKPWSSLEFSAMCTSLPQNNTEEPKMIFVDVHRLAVFKVVSLAAHLCSGLSV